MAGESPFIGGTTLACALPRAAHVRIEVHSIDGRRVATLVNREMSPGQHLVPFRLNRPADSKLGAGVYLVPLTAGGEHRNVRIVGLE